MGMDGTVAPVHPSHQGAYAKIPQNLTFCPLLIRVIAEFHLIRLLTTRSDAQTVFIFSVW